MKECNLNVDLLNDISSIYFQKNTFYFIGIELQQGEHIPDFLRRVSNEICVGWYDPKMLLMSIHLYAQIKQSLESYKVIGEFESVSDYLKNYFNLDCEITVYTPIVK
jgi:hypothetical protein